MQTGLFQLLSLTLFPVIIVGVGILFLQWYRNKRKEHDASDSEK